MGYSIRIAKHFISGPSCKTVVININSYNYRLKSICVEFELHNVVITLSYLH